MRITTCLLIAIMAGAGVSPGALAEVGGQPVKPEILKKPIIGPKKPTPAPAPSPAAFAPGPADLLCKNFIFGSMPGAMPFRSSVVQYQSMQVTDTSGAARTIYAPITLRIIHQFKPAAAPAGARGEALPNGECGLVDAVIDVPWGGLETTTPTLTFANFPTMTLLAAKKGPNSSNMDVAMTLPSCPSGVLRFRSYRQAAGDFFVTGTAPGAAACVE